MDLYLATNNKDKASELSAMFSQAELGIAIHLAYEVGGMPLVEESEDNLEANARLKALALKKIVPKNAWVLADDSGLFVDVLDGAPGIQSSRYAGECANDEGNRKKLLKALKEVSKEKRSAQFICCLVLLGGRSREVIFKGFVRGMISEAEKGNYGFGYDPLFIPEGQSETFAEMGAEIKNKISHRAEALRQLIDWLRML